MTTRGLSAIIAAVVLVASPAAAFKIGYVDLQTVVSESDAGQKAKKEFKKKVDRLEKQLQGKKDELDKIRKELERKSIVMKDSERRKLEGDFQHKQLDLKRRFEDSQAELQGQDQELTGKIVKEIQAIVKKIGESEGYDLILELGSSPILHYRKADDLTQKTLKAYNKK